LTSHMNRSRLTWMLTTQRRLFRHKTDDANCQQLIKLGEDLHTACGDRKQTCDGDVHVLILEEDECTDELLAIVP
jgi:hypothetical protein